jgi:putative acetyltransferase
LVKIAIRAYDRRDAAGTAEVFYRSAREVALSDYTVAQVKAWVPGPLDPVREHQRSSDGRLVLVAVDEDDRVVAFIDLEADGHIDRLYCAPEAAGRGIASQLYDTLEAAAREVLRGVDIHNYSMFKDLAPAADAMDGRSG